MALLLLLFLLQSLLYAQAQQNISLGSSLTPEGPNTAWLSPSGDFAFGFRPLEGNTSSYLVAIWFNNIDDKTVAWYATNGETLPRAPSGSRLQLTSDGVLSLRDPGDAVVWSPAVNGIAYASMLDSDNFILHSADGSIKWQSFMLPCDTILPFQVLPLDTDIHSRLMDTDYSRGRFILSVTSDGNLVFYPVAVPSSFRYDPYWAANTAGNGSQLVFDATGRVYLSLKSGEQLNITSAAVDAPADFYHRATLDSDGVFRQYVYPRKTVAANEGWRTAWRAVDSLPKNICQVAVSQFGGGVCGFNSYCSFNSDQSTNCECPPNYSFLDTERKYKGCKPDFEPQSCDLDEATAVEQFELTPMDKVNWPYGDYEHYKPVGEDTCRSLCLTDCFCALVVYNGEDENCWKKRFPLSNGVFDNETATTLLKVPRNNISNSQVNSSPNGWKKGRKYWILGGSLLLGGSVLVNILFVLVRFEAYRTCCRRKTAQQSHSSSTEALPLRAFTYKELETATNSFHEELGRGASGVVYKGQLEDELRTCIAVKKIDKMLSETEKEFAIEVQTIGRTFHKNLVRLVGFCNEGSERLLVYEFMANGSLNGFLFGDVRPSWHLRVHVALAVARGLLYLHEECSTQIIHCDIKPQNILLDDNFMAKISDFGLAKLLRTNQTQTTTGIRGTRGYVAPEWFKNMGITAKVDVYSFGVILLQLVCCRRNVELETFDEEQGILAYWANDCYKRGRIDSLVEGDDEAVFNMEKVERFVAVALWCLQQEPTMRPTMLKVTQMLDGAVLIPTPPDPSSFLSSLP